MSNQEPLQAFVGGIGLALASHLLLVLNGRILGVSGFVYRAIYGDGEAIVGLVALILGGVVTNLSLGSVISKNDITTSAADFDFFSLAFSGLMVGIGTKLGNGCTSGHMIAGISRLSKRSFAATMMFFIAGALTSSVLHGHLLPRPPPADWTMGPQGKHFFFMQVTAFLTAAFLYILPAPSVSIKSNFRDKQTTSFYRLFSTFITVFLFAVSLRMSGMTNPGKILSFLVLPFHEGFDPSLLYLATGALPLAIALYHYARGDETPRLGGQWDVPKATNVDARLLLGSATFGVGWGMCGICPGPGLVYLGISLHSGSGFVQQAVWIIAMIAGSFLPSLMLGS